MKINPLNESTNTAMKFKVVDEEKYVNKPTIFLISVGRDTVIELTLEQITTILRANGYGEPIWKVGSERGYLI